MTEQLLFIDNKAMDINESTNITLNFRSNIFSDVSKITSNNTYSIKLPLTVNNCHVINYAHLPSHSAQYARINHKGRYLRNGIEIIPDASVIQTRDLTPAEALSLTVESFRFMAAFEGDVPGASEVECCNYRDMDLPAAKAEAAAMLPVLEALTADKLHY